MGVIIFTIIICVAINEYSKWYNSPAQKLHRVQLKLLRALHAGAITLKQYDEYFEAAYTQLRAGNRLSNTLAENKGSFTVDKDGYVKPTDEAVLAAVRKFSSRTKI